MQNFQNPLTHHWGGEFAAGMCSLPLVSAILRQVCAKCKMIFATPTTWLSKTVFVSINYEENYIYMSLSFMLEATFLLSLIAIFFSRYDVFS